MRIFPHEAIANHSERVGMSQINKYPDFRISGLFPSGFFYFMAEYFSNAFSDLYFFSHMSSELIYPYPPNLEIRVT